MSPRSVESYSQEHWREDVRAVVDGLKLDQPHVVGLSMGAFATLHFGMTYCARGKPLKARSLTLAGVGSGAHPATYKAFQASAQANAEEIRKHGMAHFADTYGHGAARIQFQKKDPRGFAEYNRQLAEHSAPGIGQDHGGIPGPAALPLRPDGRDLAHRRAGARHGWATRTNPASRRPSCSSARFPRPDSRCSRKSGHGINVEEPGLFNQLLDDFLRRAEDGTWGERDPRAAPPSIWGPGGKP